MNKIMRKAKVTGDIFVQGMLVQLEDPSTLSIAATVGVYQGLKYNGNLGRGIKGGVAVLGAMAIVNGLRCVVGNIDVIKQA